MKTSRLRLFGLVAVFFAGGATTLAGSHLLSPKADADAPAPEPVAAGAANPVRVSLTPAPLDVAGEQAEAQPTRPDLEETFRRLPESSDWATERRQSVTEHLTKALGDVSSIKDVDCRDGMCRVTVVHRDEAGPSLLMSRLSERPIAGFTGARVFDEDGQANVVYLEREPAANTDEPSSLSSVTGRFTGESHDRAWADEMTTQIESSLGSVLDTGTAIEAVECRSVHCKIVVLHENDAARQAFFGAYSLNPIPATAGAQMFSSDENGDFKTVLFVSREGTVKSTEG